MEPSFARSGHDIDQSSPGDSNSFYWFGALMPLASKRERKALLRAAPDHHHRKWAAGLTQAISRSRCSVKNSEVAGTQIRGAGAQIRGAPAREIGE